MKINTNKAIVLGDMHYGEDRNSSHALQLNNDFCDELIADAKEREIDTLIQLGDVFHSRSALDVKVLNGAFDAIKKLANHFENVIICVGNHDIYYKNDTAVNSLKPFGEISNVHVIESTEEIEFECGKKGLLTAWNTDLDALTEKYDYMFGHFEPNGAMYSGAVAKGNRFGLSDLTKIAPMVFSGHFHIAKNYPTKTGIVKMVGSIREFNFGDINNDKRYIVLDAEHETQIDVINKTSPRHVILHWSKCSKKTYKINTDEIKSNRIKLIVDCKYKYEDLLDFIKELYKHEPIKVDPDYVFSASKDLLADAKKQGKTSVQLTNLEYIKNFIADMNDSNGFIDGADRDKLTAMAIEYYNNSMNDIASSITTDVRFEDITIQNFKSVGPAINFDYQAHEGLNFIYGVNQDIEGSRNGVGKSVIFIEAPLFALYGKTLMNTANKYLPNRVMQASKTDTLVVFTFSVNGKRYKIENIIKAKQSTVKVNIYEWVGITDGIEEWKDLTKSTSKETRKFIVEEVIGCTYELAKATIALSSSAEANFLTMKKSDKRQHISDVFKLKVFIIMLDLVRNNKKIAHADVLNIQKQIRDVNLNIDTYNEETRKFEIQRQEKETDIVNSIADKEKELTFLVTELTPDEQILEESIKPHDELKKKLVEMKTVIANERKEVVEIQEAITNIDLSIKSNEVLIRRNVKELEEIDIKDLEKELLDGLNFHADKEQILSTLNAELIECQEVDTTPITDTIHTTDNEVNKLTNEITQLTKEIEQNELTISYKNAEISKFKSLSEILCSSCRPTVDNLYGLDVLHTDIHKLTCDNMNLKMSLDIRAEDIMKFNLMLDQLEEALVQFKEVQVVRENVESCIKTIESSITVSAYMLKNKTKEIRTKTDKITELTDEINKLSVKNTELSPRYDAIVKQKAIQDAQIEEIYQDILEVESQCEAMATAERILVDARGKIQVAIANKQNIENQILAYVKSIETEKNAVNPFLKMIKDCEKKIKDYTTEMSNRVEERELLKILELVCDEKGAKSYIIVDLVEIMNNLTRKYLEKMGSKYTVLFDAIFEPVFLTSTGECDYSSFSCGERQRINIATLFAFNDILRDGGIKSNVKIIDELLDGGVDAFCIDALINILKKQSVEHNQAMYIISHREEIATNPLIDNVIEVTKHNEVSSITRDEQDSGVCLLSH